MRALMEKGVVSQLFQQTLSENGEDLKGLLGRPFGKLTVELFRHKDLAAIGSTFPLQKSLGKFPIKNAWNFELQGPGVESFFCENRNRLAHPQIQSSIKNFYYIPVCYLVHQDS